MDLTDLDAETFSRLRGSTFRLTPPEGETFEAVLADVSRGAAGVGREQFALLFTGGPTPPAAQGTFGVEHPDLERLDLFLVPLGPETGEQRYEAVFT